MTNKEAISKLKKMVKEGVPYEDGYLWERLDWENEEACKMAIKALENHDTFMKYSYEQGKKDALSQEPCRVKNELKVELNELKPCTGAVSREAVLKIIDGWYEQNRDAENIEDLIVLITYMDSVTQKSGKWIENASEYQNIDPPYICSECGNMHLRKTDYCDQCGCRMVESRESEG